jgi:hypothetical protein
MARPVVPVRGGSLGRPGEQLNPVQPSGPLRVVDPLPQLQGPLVVPVRFGEGTSLLGRLAGGDPGWQGPGGLAGGVPVGGQLGRGDRRWTTGQLRAVGQGLRVPAVEPDALAGQQVGLDDLAEQGMA